MDSRATPSVAAGASLAVSLVGVAVFGSIVLAIGGDAEGRDFGTVAPWALPGLAMAALAAVMALRALLRRGGHRVAVVLAAAVAASVALTYTLNLSLGPPVP